MINVISCGNSPKNIPPPTTVWHCTLTKVWGKSTIYKSGFNAQITVDSAIGSVHFCTYLKGFEQLCMILFEVL